MAKPKPTRISVSERALIQRINRKLAKEGELLRTQRFVWHQGRPLLRSPDVGHYYIIDSSLNGIVKHDIDLEDLGRELGALRPWEGFSPA